MKKVIKFISIILGMLLLFTILQKPQPADALASYWKTSHWVTLKKNVTVYKLSNTDWGKRISTHTAKAGSHYKLSHWDINYSWVLQSGKYNTGNNYTYMINKKYNDASWFKMGIHKATSLKKYKSFHGYKIARSKYVRSNTFYEKSDHVILSHYRPTQVSKIIFEHGLHIYPTHHEWDYSTKDNKYVTDYHFKNGKWRKGTTAYFGK
ncbi:hypothetical protein [Lactiplantibacillus songbeiensis]|uniref:Surface layer protein A domain-containing protein n=1 Tax=Lactiplantibacillus songbeiensis TaxID=2559920 RepID=A0ABW4C5M8_9LACO|nr:hypothetical protein [Lactiplantibacillus songbeiensis]